MYLNTYDPGPAGDLMQSPQDPLTELVRQTDHTTSVARGCIFAFCVSDDNVVAPVQVHVFIMLPIPGHFCGTMSSETTKSPLHHCKLLMMSGIKRQVEKITLKNMVLLCFQVSYQLKILTTALFSVAMLKKRLSRLQWLSLIFLFLGVAVVQLQPSQATPIKDSSREQSIVIGLSAVCAASMMSGFAGVYFEKLLKHTSPSIFLRNVQLGVIGVVFGLAAMYFNNGTEASSLPYMCSVRVLFR